MLIVLGLALARQVTRANRAGVELVSWYWHFVDGVWVVVFTVVYLVGTVSAELQAEVGRDAWQATRKIWPQPEAPAEPDSVEMPRPTVAPLVLALGLALLAAGRGPRARRSSSSAPWSSSRGWASGSSQLLPGRGHVHEPLVEPARRPSP